MSSLIFKRDFENPHFRKLDSIVNFQTPQISLPTSPTSSITRSDQPSPHASLKPSPMSNFHKHKASLPNLKHGFENLTELSTPKSKVQVIPISNLYTDRSNGHSRSKSDLPPLLSCRNYNAPLVSALRIKEPYTARNHVEVQHFSPRGHVEQVKHEKDPFEHQKLLDYLDYLERNNQIDLKQKLKPKAKKGSPTKSKKSLDTSNINSSRLHTAISMESIKDRSVSKGPTTKLFESNLYDSSSSKFNRSLAKSPSNLNLVTRENTIDVSLAIKEVSTKNRVINRFVKQSTEKKLYRNSFEPMFKVIAQNLNEIYGVFMNEKKVISVLETLSEKNPKLLELVSAKSHKIVNYDTHKLEQRFAMVEVVNETLSIPVRLEKMKQGVILVEPSIIKELTAFNERLEEYIIKKKRDQLKLIEDRLIQTEDNLQNLFSKKTTEMRQKNRLKQYTEAKAIISERPKLGFYYFTADNPVQVVETHLQEHGELKNIKAKNLEHARGLQEVFASWRQHIGKT